MHESVEKLIWTLCARNVQIRLPLVFYKSGYSMFKDINLLLFHTNYSILHCVIPELQAGRVDPRVGSGQKIYK